jgi:hypothetical protein
VHPDDCAELVAHSVEELRSRAARLGLPVEEIALEDSFRLYVRMRIKRRESLPAIGPLGGPIALSDGKWVTQVPLLGRPTLEQQAIVFFDCFGWDSQPPTAELLDETRAPLPPERWPRDLVGGGIVFGHPDFPGRPFFCRPLLREYHTHPEHADNPWDRYREGTALHGIVLGLLGALRERWIL